MYSCSLSLLSSHSFPPSLSLLSFYPPFLLIPPFISPLSLWCSLDSFSDSFLKFKANASIDLEQYEASTEDDSVRSLSLSLSHTHTHYLFPSLSLPASHPLSLQLESDSGTSQHEENFFAKKHTPTDVSVICTPLSLPLLLYPVLTCTCMCILLQMYSLRGVVRLL